MMRRKALIAAISVAVLAVILATGIFTVLFRPHGLNNVEAPDSLKAESLAFIRDVVGFNLTDYQVVSTNFWLQWDVATQNGLPLYLHRYNLKSSNDEAHVDLYYTKANNDTYLHESYFEVYSNNLFSPAYPSDKVLNWTRGLIERYEDYKNNSAYLIEAHETLDSINRIEPMNTTHGNMTLQITIKQFTEEDIYTTLQFRPVNSTAKDYDDAVTFDFHNGALLHFGDSIG